MSRPGRIGIVTASVALCLVGTAVQSAHAGDEVAGGLMLWAERIYHSQENPLQSEVAINGKTVNIYTSDTWEPVGQYVKEGWNTVTVKTTPQEPASRQNGLVFRIGPTHRDARQKKTLMEPVLWEFRNNTDWALSNGTYSHALGPGVKAVTLTFRLYYAGVQAEQHELGNGDYVLQARPKYLTEGTQVTGTVFINGTPLSSFTLAARGIVVTPYLKKGKNDIKLISNRVDNVVRDNDIEFEVAGPAEWYATQKRFVVKPVLQFKCMQGWTRDARSGRLINQAQPASESVERVIPFVLRDGGTQ